MFFKKKRVFDTELISLHIPKTAGTSFRHMLKEVYGDDQVVRFDINEKGIARLNQQIYEETKLPSVKVIHGHFSFTDITSMAYDQQSVKMITWLRNPVSRVISNYFYLEQRLKDLLDEEKNQLNILSKMQRSLMEYARAEVNRNRQSKFLRGADMDAFDFIGIQEDFDRDIIALAGALGWSDLPPVLHHNKTKSERHKLSSDILEEIRDLNKDDVQWYHNVLKMRGKNIEDYA